MHCENCGDREAEIQLTSIEGGEMVTSHLCGHCAAEKGLASSAGSESAPLTDFLAQIGEKSEETALARAAESCPFCGTSALDFRRTGRLGCSQCYVHFAPQLKPVLRRVHGATQHVGKLYLSQVVEGDDVESRVATLQRRLDRAVEVEDFETAAQLRDKIHELETE